MTSHNIEQGAPEWLALRCGRVTASRVSDVLAKTKTGYGASRGNYLSQLVCERLTGTVEPCFTNAAMQWGTDKEPFARNCYSFVTGNQVTEVGFVEHPTIPLSGCSPDGLVGEDGLVEFKCPNTATHIDTLLNGRVPDRYLKQIMWQLACHPGRAWCDFASYDPRLPEAMQLYIKRVPRDDTLIAEMEAEVTKFLAEIADTVNRLSDQYLPANDDWRGNIMLAG